MPVDQLGTLTFDEFEARVKADCESEWAAVAEPDGDPPPRLYIYRDAHPPASVHSFDIPPEAYSSRAGKDGVVLLVRTVVAMGGRWVALAQTGMRAKTHELTERDHAEIARTLQFPEWWMQGAANLTELLKDRPDRVAEEALVLAVSEDRARTITREVRRTMARPPELAGDWSASEGDEHDGALMGPLIDAVQNHNTEGVPEMLRDSGVARMMGVQL